MICWHSLCHASGTWFWWSNFEREWTVWVIDDSLNRGRGTEYRIAVSLRTVTLFSHKKYAHFRAAKIGAVEMMARLQACPLDEPVAHFSKKTRA